MPANLPAHPLGYGWVVYLPPHRVRNQVEDFAQSGINSGGAELLSTVSIHTEGSRYALMGLSRALFQVNKHECLGLKKTQKVTVSTVYRWGPAGTPAGTGGAAGDRQAGTGWDGGHRQDGPGDQPGGGDHQRTYVFAWRTRVTDRDNSVLQWYVYYSRQQ